MRDSPTPSGTVQISSISTKSFSDKFVLRFGVQAHRYIAPSYEEILFALERHKCSFRRWADFDNKYLLAIHCIGKPGRNILLEIHANQVIKHVAERLLEPVRAVFGQPEVVV